MFILMKSLKYRKVFCVVFILFYFMFFCLVDENTKHFLILLRVCGKKMLH